MKKFAKKILAHVDGNAVGITFELFQGSVLGELSDGSCRLGGG